MVRKGWKQVTLGDIALFQGGSQPPLSVFSSQKKAGYIRLVQIRDYKTDKYATYIPEKLAKRFCKQDDIMIGRYGPPIFQILRGIEGAYNVALIKALPQGVDKEFLYHTLKREDLFEYIALLSRRTSGQTGVDLTNLKAFELSIPVLTDEQATIAKALSDVDSLISSLQKLIEKKKAIKQGAMQELLTGKKRLPGFSGEWEKNTLKQICEFINGRAYSQHELLSRGKYKVLRLGNLFTNSHWYYTDLELDEKQYCETGDLLYAWSASFGPTIWDGEKSVFHYHIWKIKCSETIDKKYLYHFLNADVSSILNELQGGTMSHLTKENMENRLCSYPKLDEQQAIAQVLSDMDSEIEQLEKKLVKYQQIKQGMMQELLTGRIRLKEGENNV